MARMVTPRKWLHHDLFIDWGVTLSDTGLGISANNQANVFERFFKADKTGESGSGLGLPILKWIADPKSLHRDSSLNEINLSFHFLSAGQ